MSQWAVLYAAVSRRLKQIPCLFSNLGGGRLVLLFVIAISLALVISDDNVIADVLFQSPAEQPADTPVPPTNTPVPPTPEPPPPPPPTEPAPAAPPPAEPAPAEPVPAEPPPAEPPSAEPATDFVSPVSPIESISPVSPVLPASSEPPPLAQPAPAPSGSGREDLFLEEEEEPSSNFILDQVELVDTVVVSGAYIWLCCGIALFLFIPLIFLLLQIRGQLKIRKEEDF